MYFLLVLSVIVLGIIFHLILSLLVANKIPNSKNSQEIFLDSSIWEEKFIILDREIQWLGNFASISTMLGLLGTVIGIQESFSEMQKYQQASIDVFAGGISQALMTTIFGLVIAIPSILLMHTFRHFLDSLDQKIRKKIKN